MNLLFCGRLTDGFCSFANEMISKKNEKSAAVRYQLQTGRTQLNVCRPKRILKKRIFVLVGRLCFGSAQHTHLLSRSAVFQISHRALIVSPHTFYRLVAHVCLCVCVLLSFKENGRIETSDWRCVGFYFHRFFFSFLNDHHR